MDFREEPAVLVSEKEYAVLCLLKQGKTMKEAAQELGIKSAALTRRLDNCRLVNGLHTTHQLMYLVGVLEKDKRKDTSLKTALPEG